MTSSNDQGKKMIRSLLIFTISCVLFDSYVINKIEATTTTPAVAVPDKNEYIIEMPVFVDSHGVEKWRTVTGTTNEEEIVTEIRSFLTEVAEMFSSLEEWGDELKIRLVVPEIRLVHDSLLSSDTIRGQSALDEFHVWLKNEYKNKYDIAFLYTGAEILGQNNRTNTIGYANIGKVCEDSGLFVLEVTGKYTDAITLAHEAGHVLGANHDGQRYARECFHWPMSTTVMGPATTGKAPDQYFFSNCSYNDILKTVSGKQGTCLKNGDLHHTVIPGDDPRPGVFLTPDDMCRRAVANWSYVDRAKHQRTSYGDSVCVILYCLDGRPGKPAYNRVATHQGMRCGPNKQCIRGECVKARDGLPSVTDWCPLGDQPTIKNGKQCSDLSSKECFEFGIQCCESCEGNIEFPRIDMTTDKACEELEGKGNWSFAHSKYDSFGGDEMCARFICTSTSTATQDRESRYNTHKAPNGLSCGQNMRCYEGQCVVAKN